MIRPSLFLTSLLSLAIAAPLAVGCAAPTGAASDHENVTDTQDELTASASKLAGSYSTTSPAFGGFALLDLASNGKYTASVDAGGRATCVRAPCLLQESGTWSASKKAGGGLRLRVRPAGDSTRVYDAVKTGSTLELAKGGTTETLHEAVAPDPTPSVKHCGGLAGLSCGANEVCVDDPSDSCDPTKGGADCMGICKPASTPPPPPAPSCFGAWLDNNGLCRTPADGVYPASCCAQK